MIRDPARSSVVVVTLPEPLVLKETAELCAALKTEVGRRADLIAINRVPVEDPPGALEALRQVAVAGGPAAELLPLYEMRQTARLIARRAISEATALDLGRTIELPETATDPEPLDFAAWIDTILHRGEACRA
jgi:hypothetical protein